MAVEDVGVFKALQFHKAPGETQENTRLDISTAAPYVFPGSDTFLLKGTECCYCVVTAWLLPGYCVSCTGEH